MSTVYRNENSFCGPISMLKKLANGELVLVFREALRRPKPTHGDPTTRTSLLRSNDEGETWHSLVTPDPGGGNGTTVNQLSDGRLIVTNFHWKYVPLCRKEELAGRGGYREQTDLGMATACDGVFVTTSDTDGYTWEATRRIEAPDAELYTTAGRVVELADGSLLIPMNGKRPGDVSNGCWLMRSIDGGATWGDGGTVAAGRSDRSFHELRILPLPSGRILAMMRTRDANFCQSHSADAGETWSAPEETPAWCGGSSPGDLLLLRDGRVLFTYGHRRPPYGVRACLSADEGRSWDMAREAVLRDDGLGRDMGYPSSEQLDDGSILTVHYWHEEDQVRYLAGVRWQPDA